MNFGELHASLKRVIAIAADDYFAEDADIVDTSRIIGLACLADTLVSAIERRRAPKPEIGHGPQNLKPAT